MIEVIGDLFRFDVDFYGITTNGIVNNGKNVMGAGVAKQFLTAFPGIDIDIGEQIIKHGNHVLLVPEVHWNIVNKGKHIFTFPTKNYWRDKSDLELIKRSAKELALLAEQFSHKLFILPYPGIGMGGLTKKQVCPIIASILPDNVLVIERG